MGLATGIGGIEAAMAMGPSAMATILGNPGFLQNAADFGQGFLFEGPPPPSPAGYNGAINRRVISDIWRHAGE